MRRVLVTFNPDLSRTDQWSLVQRVSARAHADRLFAFDYYQSLLIATSLANEVIPQAFVDAINDDPDMLALENLGDRPSKYGYVVPVASCSELGQNGVVRIEFEAEADASFARVYFGRSDYVSAMVMDTRGSRVDGSDDIRILPSARGLAIELKVAAKKVVVTGIPWDELKYRGDNHYFCIVT